MKTLIALTLVCGLSNANAGFMSGNKLLQLHVNDTATAIGYVMGVHDAGDGKTFCTPDAASAGQLTDVVIQAIQRSPNVRHMSAATLIAAALYQEWPCKATKSKDLI